MVIYVATYDGYTYDAIALGSTEEEARAALRAEWERQFPTADMTDEEWSEAIYVRAMRVPSADIG